MKRNHEAVWNDDSNKSWLRGVLSEIPRGSLAGGSGDDPGLHIANYSIFLKDDRLYSYFEYVGDNFENDMEKMATHAKTREWWAIMSPMQKPLETRKSGEWCAEMEEVFHLE